MILNSKVLGSSKKKIIILHGFLGSLDNWITFSKKISENNFEVHLLDQRNHGKSFHSNEFNYELMVKDLHEYMSKFNINSVSIIGHSMGGKTAMLFSLIYPDLVEKLIVVDILPVSYNKNYDLIFTERLFLIVLISSNLHSRHGPASIMSTSPLSLKFWDSIILKAGIALSLGIPIIF